MDKQALIQVETNNFVEMGTEIQYETVEDEEGEETIFFSQDYTEEDAMFLIHVGEDRGARIDIEGSTFKHSRFCKGLITYRQEQEIEFEDLPEFFRLNKQLERDSSYTISDDREEQFIKIKNSLFENLAYKQSIDVLSNLDSDSTACGGSGISSGIDCIFEPFDHRGMILNLGGFNGTVQI